MNKYARFLWFTIPVGVSASLCGASAQADTWVGVPMPRGPQYKVEAVRFHSNHETWHDWLGADEVRVAG